MAAQFHNPPQNRHDRPEEEPRGRALKLFGSHSEQHLQDDRCGGKQITTIFFDLDNTLIPTRKGDAKACSKVADHLHAEHGVPRDLTTECATSYLAAFRRCPDNPEMQLAHWRTQLWEDCLPASHRHLAPVAYARWLEYRTRYLMPSSDILAMLRTLRRHYQLGIITNGPSAAQWEKVDRLQLGGFFDCILVSADLPWAKPDRNIFYAACHYLAVRPEQCAIIGDKLETDVQGGVESRLGLTVWLPLPKELQLGHDKTLDDLEDHIRPDVIVTSVLDLPSVLPKPPPPALLHRQLVHEDVDDDDEDDFCAGGAARPVYVQKTTRNRAASYNRFLPDVPDLFSSSSNSCDSNGSMDSN